MKIETLIVIPIVVLVFSVMIPFYQVQEDSNTLDVVFIDGQSNAAPYPTTIDLSVMNEELPAPTHNIYYYGTSSSVIYYPGNSWNDYGIYPAYKDGSYVVGSLDGPLAYYLSEKQGRDTLVINLAVSGSKVSELIPGQTKGDWGISVINHAMKEIKGYDHINIIGWIWGQGEWDATTDVDDYKTDFLKIDKYFKSIGAKECWIVKTRGNGNAVISQNELIEEYPNIHMGTDITDTFTQANGLLVDSVHYSQAGRILVAESLSETIPIKSFDSVISTIVDFIPILIAVGILLAIVYWIFTKKG